jgi:2',3'-cyclic-nucleotide 2'-phosphodiesterase/3'-nucleotidase
VSGITAPVNCGAPKFPVVLANVVGISSQKPIFNPYSIIPKRFNARHQTAPAWKLNVGIMGFVPPQIMDWDQKSWRAKSWSTVGRNSEQIHSEMRTKGADLVVALSHGGLDASAYSPKMENASCT